MNEHAGIIHKLCRAYSDSEEDYQDYLQEVAYHLWKSMDNFKGDSKISTWIYRLVLNVCLTQLKKNKIRKDTISNQNSVELSFKNYYESNEDEHVKQLYAAIRKLNEIDRALILLYLDKHKLKDIAKIMGMTLSNVGVKINRLKKELKTIING